MKITLSIATEKDAAMIAALDNEVADDLTARYGKGHWSYKATERGVLFDMKGDTKVLLARYNHAIVAKLRLTTKKPWAIDTSYFTEVARPLYLVGMAVHPQLQRRGVGKAMLKKAVELGASWPAQAIRLDAYDAAAGAGDFYRKSGYKERGHVVFRENPLIYFELLI